jgi:hypothetical protein
MPRYKKAPEDVDNAMFVGSTYSNQELAFLIEHLGEPPEVALSDDVELPEGVNAAAVEPILDRTFRLDMLEEAAKKQTKRDDVKLWVGVEALKAICEKTLEWNATVAELKRRSAGSDASLRRIAGAPSLHMWDPDTDIAYLGGVGADADIVRTALGPDGERVPLFTALREVGVGSIKHISDIGKFLRGDKAKGQKLLDSPNKLEYQHGATTSVVRCPICGHTEVFESSKPSTKRVAEQRMTEHLHKSKLKRDQHQTLAKRLASGMAGRGSARQPAETEASPEESEE